MTQGLRTRATEIVSLDLGPRTSQEIIAAQTREIEQERFTSIDRRLMRDADGEGVVRISQADPGQHASLIGRLRTRSEEHTSELQSLMRISYAVFCLKKKKNKIYHINHTTNTPNNT